jgi:hypothetical protein
MEFLETVKELVVFIRQLKRGGLDNNCCYPQNNVSNGIFDAEDVVW